jgi:hypothetical protein
MAKLTTISLSLCLCLLLSPCAVAQTRMSNSDDRVTITPHTIVFPRKPSPVRSSWPDEKTVINYPEITGLRNENALNRIQTTLQLKNIFGSTVEEYREDETGWLEKVGYVVNYNQHYILDLRFTELGSAIHGEVTNKHFTIDLRSGNVVTATDIFVAERMDQLSQLVDKKLQDEIKEIRERFRATGDQVPSPLEEILGKLKFETADLSNFEVNPGGVLFYKKIYFPYGFGFHTSRPEGRYYFTHAELKPYFRNDGLLWQFVD